MGYLGRSPTAALSSSLLQDADANTKVQVEESTNENKIRFDTAGSQRVIIDASGNVGIGEGTPLALVHVKSGDTGLASLNTGADDLFLESATGANCGMTIASGNGTSGYLVYADQDSNFRGVVQYDHSVGALRFHTEGSERVRILSGGGITFNGDTATANALDDYEEGLWDVTWKGAGGSAGSQSYHADTSSYVKVGKIVIARFYRAILDKGSWSGNLQLWGLPFTASSSTGYSGVYFFSFPSSAVDAAVRVGYCLGNTTYMTVVSGVRQQSWVQYSEIDNGYYFNGNVVYETDS